MQLFLVSSALFLTNSGILFRNFGVSFLLRYLEQCLDELLHEAQFARKYLLQKKLWFL
jgi:hypothetical protein